MKIKIIEQMVRTAEGYNFERPYTITVPMGYPDSPVDYADGVRVIQAPVEDYTLVSQTGNISIKFKRDGWLTLWGKDGDRVLRANRKDTALRGFL